MVICLYAGCYREAANWLEKEERRHHERRISGEEIKFYKSSKCYKSKKKETNKEYNLKDEYIWAKAFVHHAHQLCFGSLWIRSTQWGRG